VALVEELVDGPEVTAIGFSADGTYHCLAVTDRIVADPPAFGVALAHVFPSHVGGQTPDVAERAVRALGITDGPSYTQLRVGRDGPQVIEVAARLGGGHDAELVEAATGVDLNGLALDAALGLATTTPVPAAEAGAGGAVTQFLVAPPGLLDETIVPEDLEGVLSVRIYRAPGYVFTPLRRGSDRAGALLAVGASRGEALARAKAAADRIRFVTADAGALVQAD
jgi:biotin carboxylase